MVHQRVRQGAAGCKPGPPAAAEIPCWSDEWPDFCHHFPFMWHFLVFVKPQKRGKQFWLNFTFLCFWGRVAIYHTIHLHTPPGKVQAIAGPHFRRWFQVPKYTNTINLNQNDKFGSRIEYGWNPQIRTSLNHPFWRLI